MKPQLTANTKTGDRNRHEVEQLRLRLAHAPAPIAARFEAFHASNPAVYACLVRLARAARAKGCEKVGIAMLWERMRWELYVETDTPNGGEPYRLNNDYRAHYARRIMDAEPDLAGIFETRVLAAVAS